MGKKEPIRIDIQQLRSHERAPIFQRLPISFKKFSSVRSFE